MKIGIIIILVFLVAFFLLSRIKKQGQQASGDFVQLASEQSSTDLLPSIPNNLFQNLDTKYAGSPYQKYSNSYTELTEVICNEVYSNYKYWEKQLTHADFLNKLTPEQRVYFVLVTFESQTNNGGIYQFLFNNPELSILTLEAMQAVQLQKLAADYTNVLNEFFRKFDKILDLKIKFHDSNSDTNQQWNAFTEGYDELKTAEVIESYFYTDDFIREFQNALYNYAKDKEGKLYRSEKQAW